MGTHPRQASTPPKPAYGAATVEATAEETLEVYRRATPREIEDGERWYDDAHDEVGAIATEHGVALARTTPPGVPPGRYRPPDRLLAFLEGL